MSRKTRYNVAASVVEQANARAAAAPQNNICSVDVVLPFDSKSPADVLRSRIDTTPDPVTGAPRLLVVFPSKVKPEIYDFTKLLVQPEIAAFLAEGFRCWASSNSIRTRYKNARTMQIYLYRFFVSLLGIQSLIDIDETFWTAFLVWVNGPRKKDGQPWAEATRAQIHGTFSSCMKALSDHPEWGGVASYLLNRSGFPRRPWRGRSTKVVPTKVMSPLERRLMISACLSELTDLSQRLAKRDLILSHGQVLLEKALIDESTPPYRKEIGACAARIIEAFPNRLASKGDIFALDPLLEYAVTAIHGITEVRRLLYPSIRDLVPFVLLLGLKTAFNPSTIFSLTWNRIRISEDANTVTFVGVKGRSQNSQFSINPINDAINDLVMPAEPAVPFALTDILNLLRRLTSRTSALVTDPDQTDRLFVAAVFKGGDCHTSILDRKDGLPPSSAWAGALRDFIKTHNLPQFTLACLRFTESEMEWRRTGDLLAVRDRLGHKSVTITRTHYTSDGMRRESRERVAEIQALHHRWFQSEGRIDPRTQPQSWRSSATPGFGCMQPFDSPRPGQRKGRLCDAYGECPDCPMAKAWPQDVQAVAYYTALPKAIYDGLLGRIQARQWLEKWPPVLTALNELLDEVSPVVMVKASKFRVVLKPIG